MKRASAFLALLMFFFAGLALANTGTLTSVTGTAQAQTGTAPARTLRVGDLVRQGDTLSTGPASSAVIRFEDGQVTALTANSKMTITAYQYNAQTQSGNVLLSLIDGGMRAITGLIGNRTPQNVSYRAATATIGIRGTDITIATAGGNIVVTVNAGVISFQRVNASGQPIGTATTVTVGNGVGIVNGVVQSGTAAAVITQIQNSGLPTALVNAITAAQTNLTSTLQTAITNAVAGTTTGVTVSGTTVTSQTQPAGGGTGASCTNQVCTCPPPFVLAGNSQNCICPQGQVQSGGTCVPGN